MAAAREGMHLQKEAQVLTERMQPGVYTGVSNNEGIQGGAKALQFPRKFLARDSYDDEMNLKMQLMDKDGMTPFGQVYYDDKVGNWLQRKEAAVEAANFDAYFNANFNKNDLASRAWAQQVHPDFYRARLAELDERTDIVKRLKAMQTLGPQNKEDLYMLYLIDSGRVQLPPDWDRIGLSKDTENAAEIFNKTNSQQLTQGLIRMPLILTNKQQETNATNNKNRNAWGSTVSANNTFPVGNPPAVGYNHPLASREYGTTVANNFAKFLRQ